MVGMKLGPLFSVFCVSVPKNIFVKLCTDFLFVLISDIVMDYAIISMVSMIESKALSIRLLKFHAFRSCILFHNILFLC